MFVRKRQAILNRFGLVVDEFPKLEHIRISNRGNGFQNTVARNGPAV